MFTLQIKTTGSAFYAGKDEDQYAPEVELNRLLNKAAIKVGQGSIMGMLLDFNGHTCGSYKMDDEDSTPLAKIASSRPCLDADTTDADLAEWARTSIIPVLNAEGLL